VGANAKKYFDTAGRVTPARFRDDLLLAVLILFGAIAAAVLLYGNDRHVFLYFGDAASHIVKARLLIDSQYLPLASIGPVWLPLPHLLLLPFAAIDSLFFSGIAGPVIGIPCLAGTGMLLQSMIRRTTGSQPIAFLSAVLFCLNPNVVYMALTPMSELPLLFFVALGGYSLTRWISEGREMWLAASAAAVALASLCRYEAWVLVPFVSSVAAINGFSAWRRKEHAEAARLFSIAGLSMAGVIVWIFWNAYEFGDALRFAPWNFRSGPISVNNPQGYRQEAVAVTLLKATLNIYGPVLLLACLAGLERLRHTGPDRRLGLLHLFLALPAIFVLATILTDLVLIDEWWWNWRFVLVAGLFIIVTGGAGISHVLARVHPRPARGLIVASLLAMPVVQLAVPSVSVATYEDAAKIFSGPDHVAAAFGERLGSMHKGGRIVLFTGSYGAERIMVSSGLALKTFRNIPFPGGQDIQLPIRSGDRYVVIGKRLLPDTREVVRYWLARRELFLRYYDILSEDEHYLLLERKPPTRTFRAPD
jgi:hypothetical protein